MKTLICPYCGCSLVRLGISKEKAATPSVPQPLLRPREPFFIITSSTVADAGPAA